MLYKCSAFLLLSLSHTHTDFFSTPVRSYPQPYLSYKSHFYIHTFFFCFGIHQISPEPFV